MEDEVGDEDRMLESAGDMVVDVEGVVGVVSNWRRASMTSEWTTSSTILIGR